MSRRFRRTGNLVAVLAATSLALAACGGDDGGGGTGGGGTGEFGQLDMADVSLTISSKDFTENQVLAALFAKSFEAAGAEVDDSKINLGGTNVNREALLSGQVDAYPEYNGTGWTVHLGNDDPGDDPEALTEKTAEADLQKNDIKWVGRSEFNDTYGFATGPDLTDENGGPFTLTEMAQYIEDNPGTTVCMETEFPDRPDGLVLYEEKTGSTIPQKNIQIQDTGPIYGQTAKGQCDFGEIFTTDGRIPALDLSIVDDEGAFIIYNSSLTVRNEVYEQAPEAFDEIADKLLSGIDNDTMAELNKQVDVDGEDLEDVAQTYLEDQGFI
jgi:osmoprotectant transport system substrate-binding protein